MIKQNSMQRETFNELPSMGPNVDYLTLDGPNVDYLTLDGPNVDYLTLDGTGRGLPNYNSGWAERGLTNPGRYRIRLPNPGWDRTWTT